MPNEQISQFTEGTDLAATDEFPAVDKSDTTDAPTGTTKRFTWLTVITKMFGSRFGADAGANDTYVVTLAPTPAAYVTGEHYRFKANTANTGACTVNFNGLGAKTIKKAAGGITTDLADNDIRAGQWVDLVYDGTNMQMQSLLGNAPAGGAGGFGDVVGPSSATDNAIARFDLTTGKLIQNSNLTLPDDAATTEVGYLNIPQNSQSADYTLVLADRAWHIFHPSGDNNPRTWTIPANASVAFPVGTAVTFVNKINSIAIAITSDTLTWADDGSTGSRTLAANGICTALKITSTEWLISGTGLS